MNPFDQLILVTLVLGGCFAAVFGIARRIDNYGIVDIAWSYAFGFLAIAYAALGDGWPPRRVLLAAMVTGWSLRLGTHLAVRVMGHHPVEDGRYQVMRRAWAKNFASRMFWFFQLQSISVVVLAMPFFLIARNRTPGLQPLEIAGAIIWLVALAGEAMADRQLATFKRVTENQGRVCDSGWWRLSRHPNYFFEWLVWVGYFVFACAAPWGWAAIVSPAAILYLLLRVTGIPLTEEQSIRSKGDAYRHYQATTSAFVPWPPRPVLSHQPSAVSKKS